MALTAAVDEDDIMNVDDVNDEANVEMNENADDDDEGNDVAGNLQMPPVAGIGWGPPPAAVGRGWGPAGGGQPAGWGRGRGGFAGGFGGIPGFGHGQPMWG